MAGPSLRKAWKHFLKTHLSVAAKALSPPSAALPGHIVISPGGSGGRGSDSAYLGPKYSSISLGNGNPPQNTARPDSLSEDADVARQAFRRKVNDYFSLRRRTAKTDAYTANYEQALEQIGRAHV